MAAVSKAAAYVSASALVDWGLAERPRAGGQESGDRHVVRPFASGVLLAVLDGLGHGEPAGAAARLAAAILAEHAEEPVSLLIERCHASLAHTRGVVMSLASVSALDHTMTWLGVGNVEAVLLRQDPAARPAMQQLLLRPGVVGQKLPILQPVSLRVEAGDTLVLATDGIRSGFTATLAPGRSPRQLADGILAQHGREDDDALVLVARVQGGAW
jgi:negative regulator of sigma-B (phosphoserine phosphatase)